MTAHEADAGRREKELQKVRRALLVLAGTNANRQVKSEAYRLVVEYLERGEGK